MGIRVIFHQPLDYKPEIPADESCYSCVFVTKECRGLEAMAYAESHSPVAICRKYTGDRAEIVWLRCGADGRPVRCAKCQEDFPYGASFALVANKMPVSQVELWRKRIEDQLTLALMSPLTHDVSAASVQAQAIMEQFIAAVRNEKE
jgi:hypothetical protein